MQDNPLESPIKIPRVVRRSSCLGRNTVDMTRQPCVLNTNLSLICFCPFDWLLSAQSGWKFSCAPFKVIFKNHIQQTTGAFLIILGKWQKEEYNASDIFYQVYIFYFSKF